MHFLILSDAAWCHYVTVGCILTAMNCSLKKIRGKPLNLPARMRLYLLVKLAALEIFESKKKKNRDKRRRRDRNWDEKQVIPLSWRCQPAMWWRIMSDVWKVPAGQKALETKGYSLPLRKSTSHSDNDFVIFILLFFSSCDGEVLWAERVHGLQDAEGRAQNCGPLKAFLDPVQEVLTKQD